MRLRSHLLVYLFYLAVTLVITYPLITVIGTRMIGHPFGDAYEYTHHIWWIKTALQSGQNPFFMPNIVYPDGVNAPLLWSLPLQSFPAWLFAFALPLPAAFNISALLTLALNGWAMFWLARYLVKGRFAAALLAGLVFMLYPTFQGQLGAAHTGLLVLYPAPLYLYCLLRLRETTHVRRMILAGGLLFMVSLWGSELLLIYLIAPITAIYFLMQISARAWRTVRRALVTVILGGVFALPFVVPLALDTLHGALETGSVRYSAPLLGVVAPSFYNPLFSGWEYNRVALGLDPFERASYVGVVAAALALLAVWKWRAARWWLLLALVAWVFSLGPLLKVGDEPLTLRIDGYPTSITLPWALFQDLPLIRIARTPARFNFAVGFAVAILAGYGAAVLFGKRKPVNNAGLSERLASGKDSLSVRKVPEYRRWAMFAGLMIAIGFEYQFWWGLPTIPGEVPAPIAALAARTDIRAVFDIPGYHPLANKDGMFLQTGHQHPMIVGQVSRSSPANPAKVNLLQATLDPALLDAAGVDIVILHRQYDGNDGAIGALVREKLGAPFYEDEQYAAFEVPPPEGAPTFTAELSDATSISTQADSYMYAPGDGWVTVSATLDSAASGGRDAALLEDGTVVQRWTLGDEPLAVRVPLVVGANTFHTISFALNPVCPNNADPALECRSVGLANLALEFTPALSSDPVSFERGVRLEAAHIPADVSPGDTLPVWLEWQFEQVRGVNDIRFVHITNAAGDLIDQQDNTLGVIDAGESRAEAVEIALPDDLPPGDYTVSVGWYTYPEISNFCVLRAGACGETALTLGTMHVGGK